MSSKSSRCTDILRFRPQIIHTYTEANDRASIEWSVGPLHIDKDVIRDPLPVAKESSTPDASAKDEQDEPSLDSIYSAALTKLYDRVKEKSG